MLELVLEASKAHKEVRLFFTSSVGVANGLQTSGPIPESKLEDGSGARTGYGKSKLVAEELLWQASYKSNVDVVICRIGQIAGPVKPEHNGGEWNRKEWLPSVSLISRTLLRHKLILPTRSSSYLEWCQSSHRHWAPMRRLTGYPWIFFPPSLLSWLFSDPCPARGHNSCIVSILVRRNGRRTCYRQCGLNWGKKRRH